MDFRLLRNGFILGSFGIGFSGLILLATSYKQFSQSLISTGIGSLIASNLAIENCTSITSRKLSKKDKEILLLQKDVKNFADILTAKHGELIEVLASKESLFKNYEALEKELLLKNFQLTTTLQELKNIQQINLASAIDTLNESLDEVTQQVNNLIPYLVKKFGSSRYFMVKIGFKEIFISKIIRFKAWNPYSIIICDFY